MDSELTHLIVQAIFISARPLSINRQRALSYLLAVEPAAPAMRVRSCACGDLSYPPACSACVPEYFMEAMGRLRDRYLNVALTAVLHPASISAQRAATEQKAAARAAPAVQEEELTAQQWLERGLAATDIDEKLRFYSEAIRLKPGLAEAFYNRAIALRAKGDIKGARQDDKEAIRLGYKPRNKT